MIRNKGFTLVELLAVIVVLGIILVIAIPNILGIIIQARNDAYQRQLDMIKDATRKYVLQNGSSITWTNDTATITLSDLQNNNLIDNPLKDPRGGTIDSNISITVTKNGDQYTCVVNDSTTAATDYVTSKGVNKPKLITGMTPIKWDGTTWVDTTEDDTDWYDYSTSAKQWANARTQDGSMWVWIPRYAYQIATNYHTSTTGTINIKFLKDDTNITSDESTVTVTPTYSGSSQTNYIVHPAFTFGTMQLTGMWVAKFETSVSNTNDLCYTSESATNCNKTTLIPKIVPNVYSWRYINIGNMFTVSRNMETNNTYGWGTTGNGLDTHMMKNIEWGAVAYLSQSLYGKNSEIWVNNSTNTTGCAGDSVSTTTVSYFGCQYAYNTTNGFNASTTGNIYGIYDMSGGAVEYVAAYVNNGNSSLTTYGNSIITADSKYKDIYTVTTDSDVENYNLASTKIGDAVYETSGNIGGSYSWNSDLSYMPSSTFPWFKRGSCYSCGTGAGSYYFLYTNGNADVFFGFHLILLINSGL